MRIEGNHKCNSNFKDCNHVYDWMVVVPNHISSPIYDVEVIDKPKGQIVQTTDEKYIINIWCPKCNQDNVIEYNRN